jgi:hypothetical protein
MAHSNVPREHDKRGPLMWLDNLPHQSLEFKYRVGYIKDGE